MTNDTPYTKYIRPFSFMDKMYNFYFLDHRKQFILSLCVFIISILYLSINVFIFRRNENHAIYESIFIAAIIIAFFPSIYCKFFYDENEEAYEELFTFNTVFYRRIKTKSKAIHWKNKPRYNYRKVVYTTDTKMHSNILCE